MVGQAIHEAAWDGDVERLERLINADPTTFNALDGIGHTPLVVATRHGNAAVVKKLLELGADVELRDVFGKTAVHWAAYQLRGGPILRMVLDAGASFNTQDNDGWTPLVSAVAGGNGGCLEILLSLNAVAIDLNTAVMYPRALERPDLAKRHHHGQTPLHIAAKEPYRARCVPLLLEAGADPRLRDLQGRMPLDLAREQTPVVVRDMARKFPEALEHLTEGEWI